MVIAIMAVLAAITAPAIAPLMRNSSLRAGAAQMRAAIMRARTMAIANSVYCVPLIPIKVKDNPTQYALPGGAPDVWFDEAWPAAATNAASPWPRGGVSGLCHTNSTSNQAEQNHYFTSATAKEVELEDVLSVWAWLGTNVDGVGIAAETGGGFKTTCYWGDNITIGATKKDLGDVPGKGKWIQLAVSFKDLGFAEGDTLTGLKFIRHSTGGSAGRTEKVWWDMALIWDVYLLPENILPDPTLTTYPIEFENDGRLKPTLGGHWCDRMIIVRDLGNPEPDDYDDDTDETDVGYRVWECEPWADDDNTFWCDDETNEFDNGDYDHGLDRVKGTGDLYDSDTKGEGKGEWSYEGSPTSVPDGQMYIKINKITGTARVCAHPGG